MVHPEDADNLKYVLKQHLEKNEPFKVEYRLLTKSGEYKWVSGNGIAQIYNNKPVKMVGSLIDINDKKKLEQELQDKLDTLTKMNELMVDRELKMVELKEKARK